MTTKKKKTREPMPLPEAIKYVEASLEQLERFAHGIRGAVLPETKEAFQIVIKAAKRAAK